MQDVEVDLARSTRWAWRTLHMQLLQRFATHRDALEARVEGRLSFEPLLGKAACRIVCERPEPGDVLEPRQREALIEWFIFTIERFRPATQE